MKRGVSETSLVGAAQVEFFEIGVEVTLDHGGAQIPL